MHAVDLYLCYNVKRKKWEHKQTCSLVPRLYRPDFFSYRLFYYVRKKLGSRAWERGYKHDVLMQKQQVLMHFLYLVPTFTPPPPNYIIGAEPPLSGSGCNSVCPSVRTGAWSYIPQIRCQSYFNDVHTKTYSHVTAAPPPQCTAFTSN